MQLSRASREILLHLPPMLPFFLGPLFFGLRLEHLTDQEWLSSFLLFLLLFLSWQGVKTCAFAIIERKAAAKAEPSRGDKLLLLGLVTSALLSLAFLGVIRFKFEYFVFVIVLALLGFSGLKTSLLRKGYPGLAHLIALIYLTGIGILSMVLMMEQPVWQPTLVAFGVACSVLAAEILREVSGHQALYSFNRNGTPQGSKLSRGEQITRPVPLLLCCAPLFVAALSYMHELPRPYLAVVFVVIPSASLITKLKNAQSSNGLDPSLTTQASGISVLFIVIIALVSYLTI